MNPRPKFHIRTILVLTALAAIATVIGIRQYRARIEETRKQSLRSSFQTVADLSANLDSEIRNHLVAIPAIEASLRAKFPSAPEGPVSGSYLNGGYGGSSESGASIAIPKFSYNYHYNWGPGTRVANENEKVRILIESTIDPETMRKPILRIATGGTEIENEIVNWIEGKFAPDSIEIERRTFDAEP